MFPSTRSFIPNGNDNAILLQRLNHIESTLSDALSELNKIKESLTPKQELSVTLHQTSPPQQPYREIVEYRQPHYSATRPFFQPGGQFGFRSNAQRSYQNRGRTNGAHVNNGVSQRRRAKRFEILPVRAGSSIDADKPTTKKRDDKRKSVHEDNEQDE